MSKAVQHVRAAMFALCLTAVWGAALADDDQTKMVVASAAMADESKTPPPAKSDADIAAKKAAVRGARIGLGAWIGGKVGKLVSGGPVGAGVGVMLTPSEIGCGEHETCTKR